MIKVKSKKLLANTINSDDKYKIRNYAIICLFLNLRFER